MSEASHITGATESLDSVWQIGKYKNIRYNDIDISSMLQCALFIPVEDVQQVIFHLFRKGSVKLS